jgi:SAM-dependent methyltransferase
MDDENAAQRAFWNGPQGESWVTNQTALDALHAGVAALLLAEAAPPPRARVLDIGCGAGASTLAFAAAVGPRGTVTGIDISEPLLAHARARAEDAGAPNVAVLAADAAHHPFAAAEADQVVSRFGLMFFADPVAAFRNIATALRPGGTLVFVAWAPADRNPWFALPLAAAVERLGPAGPADPDAPGPMAFRDVARVTGLLAAAGFTDAAGTARAVDLHLAGGLDAAAALALRVGPATRHVRDKGGSEEDARAIAAAVRARFEGFVTADGIRVPAIVNLYRATRP